jgi:hypothetical protein
MLDRRLLPLWTPFVFSVLPAAAQPWVAVDLHPASLRESQLQEIQYPRQVGYGDRADNGHAQGGIWHGSSGSWVPVTDPGAQGYIFGIDGETLVGYQEGHAMIWVGPDHVPIDLHPGASSEAVNSGALKTRRNVQAGAIGIAFDVYHAGYWRGTAASFIDLHPTGAVTSSAAATDGLWVGGRTGFPGFGEHAYIWNTLSSVSVDLNPAGATSSHILGMAPGVQVGDASFGLPTHAALWRGTAQSFVDFGVARFTATTGRIHAGGTGQGGLFRAAVNLGTPESWVALHQYLPPGLSGGFSGTTCVYQDGPTIYVGGWAESSPNAYFHAVMWIGADPCYPNCDQSTVGPVLNVLDFSCYLDKFVAADPYANCDGSTTAPTLNVLDFNCFLNRFAAGCN